MATPRQAGKERDPGHSSARINQPVRPAPSFLSVRVVGVVRPLEGAVEQAEDLASLRRKGFNTGIEVRYSSSHTQKRDHPGNTLQPSVPSCQVPGGSFAVWDFRTGGNSPSSGQVKTTKKQQQGQIVQENVIFFSLHEAVSLAQMKTRSLFSGN